jgi:hypothetical protein
VGRGILGHHRHALLAHDGRRHPHAAGAAVRRAGARYFITKRIASRSRRRTARSPCTATSPAASSVSRRRVHRGPPAGRRSTSASSSSTSRRTQPLVVRPNDQGRIPGTRTSAPRCRAGSSRTASSPSLRRSSRPLRRTPTTPLADADETPRSKTARATERASSLAKSGEELTEGRPRRFVKRRSVEA